MHVETVTHTACAAGDFVITGSKVLLCRRCLIAPCRASVTRTQDGIVKFWKKRPQEIEFIKKFFAHTGSVRDISVSSDGLWLATLGECARGALQYENRGVCLMNASQARIRQSRSSMCLIST